MDKKNKLYEPLYFNKPIIVTENLCFGTKVEAFGSSLCINVTNDMIISNIIDSVDIYIIYRTNYSIEKIPLEEIIKDNLQGKMTYSENNDIK